MKTKKSRFTIGDEVIVSAIVEVFYDYAENDVDCKGSTIRMISKQPCEPFTGWIVGARRKLLGTYRPQTTSYEGDYDPAFLAVDKTVQIWLVRRGITNKAIEVLDEDIKAAGGCEWPPTVPWLYANQPPYDDRIRAELSKAAKEAKRGANGRFVKKEKQ